MAVPASRGSLPVPFMMTPYPIFGASMYPTGVVTEQPTAMPSSAITNMGAYASLSRNWSMQQYQQAVLRQAYKQHQYSSEITTKTPVQSPLTSPICTPPKKLTPPDQRTPVKTAPVIKTEVASPDSTTARKEEPSSNDTSSECGNLVIDLKQEHMPSANESTSLRVVKATSSLHSVTDSLVSRVDRKRASSDEEVSPPKRYAMNPYTGSVPVPVAGGFYDQHAASYSYPPYQYNPYTHAYLPTPPYYQQMMQRQFSLPSFQINASSRVSPSTSRVSPTVRSSSAAREPSYHVSSSTIQAPQIEPLDLSPTSEPGTPHQFSAASSPVSPLVSSHNGETSSQESSPSPGLASKSIHSPENGKPIAHYSDLQYNTSPEDIKLLASDYQTTSENQTLSDNMSYPGYDTPPPHSGGRRKFLSQHATTILSDWYARHNKYPYPIEQEVETLAKLANISTCQVKKWMANKRVRSSNTLAISGSMHPKKLHKMLQLKEARDNPEAAARRALTRTPRRFLNPTAINTLNEWYNRNKHYPYPSDNDKAQLASECGILLAQVSCWFANKRNRNHNTRSYAKTRNEHDMNIMRGESQLSKHEYEQEDSQDEEEEDQLIDVLDTSDSDVIDVYS